MRPDAKLSVRRGGIRLMARTVNFPLEKLGSKVVTPEYQEILLSFVREDVKTFVDSDGSATRNQCSLKKIRA